MIRSIWKQFTDPEGRKGLAWLFIFGASVVMTLYAAAALYLVRTQAGLVFWLGMAAHVHILLNMWIFGAQFVRRTFKAGKDGVEIGDQPGGGNA